MQWVQGKLHELYRDKVRAVPSVRTFAGSLLLGAATLLEPSGASAGCTPPPAADRVRLGNDAVDALEDAERMSRRARIDRGKYAEAILRRLVCADECDAGMINLLVHSLRHQRRYRRARSVYEEFFAGCPRVERSEQYRKAQIQYDELRRLPTLEITTSPGSADLTVDGDPWAEMQDGVGAVPLEPDTHLVRVTSEGYVTVEQRLELRDGDAERLDLELVRKIDPEEQARRIRRTLAYAGLIGAGVALTSGTVVLLVRNGEVKKYNENSSCRGEGEPHPTPTCASKLDTAVNLTTATTVLFLGAGLLGSASGVLFAITPAQGPRTPAAIRCRPLGVQGVGCRGEF